MKRILPILFACLALSVRAEELTLERLSSPETPENLRLDFIESYLGIKRHDWKITVPAGYEAVFLLHQRSKETMLELKISEKNSSNIYLVTAPDRSSPERIQITFGNQAESITTYMPQPESWKLHFGNPGAAKDGNLFEIWNSENADGPLYWCEVHFGKKN